MNAKSKHRKSQVVTIIVDAVKDSSTQARGGFVRKDTVTGKWFEVEDKIAREKVGHALRDAIKLEERRAKKRERKEKISSEGTMAETSKPPMAKRRRIENSRESSSLALAIVGEEFGDMLPTSGTTKEDWEKSLKESASKFSLSDCEETDDAVSNKGGIITTLQSSIIENNNTQNPLYPMETNLSPIPIITIPEKATSWKPIVLGDTIAQKNSIPSLDIPCDSNQFQHMPMANWNPPGDSITEEAYKAYLQSKANSSGDLISSHFDLLEYPIKPSSSLQKGQPPTLTGREI